MTKPVVINTRPTHLQNQSNQQIIAAGFEALSLPCIDIVGNPHQQILKQLQTVNKTDVIVFTSQFAVRYAYKINPQFDIHFNQFLICVGTKTAELLNQHVKAKVQVPEQQNSQGIINLLSEIKNIDRLVLVTATGGRNEIQNYIQSKGIKLEQINVYQRVIPNLEQKALLKLELLNEYTTLATSVTSLKHLKQLLPKALWIKTLSQPLICASERICQQANAMGFEFVQSADSANIEIMLSCIKKAS